jgi:hypothetical protein
VSRTSRLNDLCTFISILILRFAFATPVECVTRRFERVVDLTLLRLGLAAVCSTRDFALHPPRQTSLFRRYFDSATCLLLVPFSFACAPTEVLDVWPRA